MKNLGITSVKAALPATVRRFSWTRNHHFLEIEDERGNKAKLHAGGLLRGECEGESRHVVFAVTRDGAMVCGHCLSPVKWQWVRPQLAFLPEHEAMLMGFDTPDAEKPPLTAMQRAWLVFYTAITRRAPKAKSAPSPAAAEHVPGVAGAVMDDETTPVGEGGLGPKGQA